MTLAYLASSSIENHAKTWMLRESAERLDIPLQFYAQGLPFGGNVPTKIDRLIPELMRLSADYTHVMYLDGVDTFFVRDAGYIEDVYKALGSPRWFLSAEEHPYPHAISLPEHLRYPNTGLYMGEITALIRYWQTLRDRYDDGADNEQGWVLRGLADGCMPDVAVDVGRVILRSDADTYIGTSEAAVLHFNGGYFSPHNGREDRMRPTWNARWKGLYVAS